MLCLVLGICGSFLNPVFAEQPSLKTVIQWNTLDFDYESDAARQADIDSQFFIPGVPTPVDVDVYYSRKYSHRKLYVELYRNFNFCVNLLPLPLVVTMHRELEQNLIFLHSILGRKIAIIYL